MAQKTITVKRRELDNLRMVGGNEARYSTVIDQGQVKEWVGIGWISLGPPTREQRKTLPIVID
jgi:hypothetical protein